MYSWPVVCHIFIVCWLTVGYHVINGPSVILGIQPSPSFDRLAHQRSKIGQSIPSLPVSARLGGFVKNPASLDRSNNGGQNLQSSVDKGIRKSIRKSPEKYGPSPPPLCSFIAGKNTGGKVSDKQSFPATVTVKRPIILGPDDSDNDDSDEKSDSRDRSGRLINRATSGHSRSTGGDSRLVRPNSLHDGADFRNGSTVRTENRLSRPRSSRHGDGIRLERSIHGIDINTSMMSGLVDTHMHIDLSLCSLGQCAGITWAEHCKRHSARFPTCYEGGIAVFCQPEDFKCSSAMLNEAYHSDKLWMTFGVHPHFADRYSEDSLRACLHKFKSKIVALGEIGLDCSHNLQVQKEVFRSQAEIGIECNLPLVIHTRLPDGNAEALAFMRQFVPRDYRIHRHCFIGKLEEANEWLSHFRNCYIGFTPLINTQPDLMEVARQIPFDRILLETDAPYFQKGLPMLEDGGQAAFTVPGDVIYTAIGIAKARNISIEAIICQTRLNAKAIYGI
ncbi:putative deoxyribonuclease TATDN2 isoform X2 [Varroa destructor]|uniref:Uncharacterized protein n=1 Tax=Varroa destructor TaxID=109461 RepID=A0A7M7JJD1_VARDE|nr:putative deoxyribonuclease TATDN2 isoform X2 [Varroa destructor]